MNNRRFILFLAAVLLLAGCQQVPEIKKTIHECAAPFEGRACGMCFSAGDKAYIATGRVQNGSYSSSMLCYDASADRWTAVATPLKTRVNGTVCATSKGVFMGLGYHGYEIYQDTSYLNDWWKYEPATGTWTQLADYPVPKVVGAVSWSDDEHIWVACGFVKGFTNDVYCYNISTDSWSKAADSPLRVHSAVAATCQGRHFFGTGFRNTGHNAWWEFLDDGHYEQRASLPGAGRHNAACAATEKAVWVFAGIHYGDTLTTGFYFNDILRYSPEADQWALCGTLPCGTMENGAACAIGNRIYFGLGEDKNGKLHTHWYYIDD